MGMNRRTVIGNALRTLAAAACALALGACDRGGGTGQIRVTTSPEGATLTCNGSLCDATPSTIQRLTAGTYLLVAEKPGYVSARRTVSIMEGTHASVDMTLEPLHGLVLVQSNPTGAEVRVNGAFRGKTPVFVPDLPPGTHRFVFSAPGRLPREVEEIVQDRIPKKIFAELPLNAGRLIVRSVPEGAKVFLNGAERGAAPCEIVDAPSGENVVELRLDGYTTYSERLTIAAQETKEVAGTLKAVPTVLQVVSLPEGARIYVDNQFRGAAPIKLTDLAPGDHRLRAELKGFEEQVRAVSLRMQSEVVEEFRMTKNSGKIVVVSEPANAKVFINGEEAGTTKPSQTDMVSEALEIDLLPPGQYRVQLMRKGYVHTARTVTLNPNAVADLHEKMTRRLIPDTRLRVKSGTGEIVRDGMLLRTLPNGNIELQLETGTIMTIEKADIISTEPLKAPGTL